MKNQPIFRDTAARGSEDVSGDQQMLGRGASQSPPLGHSDIPGPTGAIDVVRLHEGHAARAVRLASLLPLVPECAAVVFAQLDRAEKKAGSTSYAFLGRLMAAADERVREVQNVGVGVAPEGSPSREIFREVWRNHHLIQNMQVASPELRQVVRAVLDVLSADGIRGRLGEPGFLAELSQRTVSRCADAAALFRVGTAGNPPPSHRLLVRDIVKELGEYYSEFSPESLTRPSPLVMIARRAAHHAWCARGLSHGLEGPQRNVAPE